MAVPFIRLSRPVRTTGRKPQNSSRPKTMSLYPSRTLPSPIDIIAEKRAKLQKLYPLLRSRPEPLSCSLEELLEILVEPSGGHFVLPTDPYNEVYPRIFLSDGTTALCTSLLRRIGVTHVLNAAQGKQRPNQVNTSAGFYVSSEIKYLGLEAFDTITFKLTPYFNEAANFIQDALDNGGKVLVHCRAGISRSATLVLAYLMIKQNLTAQEAVRKVRSNRAIIPNDGFLRQLCELNDKLYPHKMVLSS